MFFESRRAADSTEDPMVDIFSMRLPHDLRILGARKAKVMGLSSLGEYMRFLLARDIDSDEDNVTGCAGSKVLRTSHPE